MAITDTKSVPSALFDQETIVEHRCRLYENQNAGGQIKISKVWDSISQPYAETDLPPGKLVATFTGEDLGKVRGTVNEFIAKLDYPLTGSWNDRGML